MGLLGCSWETVQQIVDAQLGTTRDDKRFAGFNILLAADLNLLPLVILSFLFNAPLLVDVKPPQNLEIILCLNRLFDWTNYIRSLARS